MPYRRFFIAGAGLLQATCGHANVVRAPHDGAPPQAATHAERVEDEREAAAMEAATHVEEAATPHDPAPPTRVFPLRMDKPGLALSHFDAAGCTGTFGAGRSPGRVHAGCDLYFIDDDGAAYKDAYYKLNKGTPVYAVADGTIVEYAPFYAGTFALVVNHGDFVARYGEVSSRGLPDALKVGSAVKAGQHIADMGDLQMSTGHWAMLHFELYSAERTGPLSDFTNHTYAHVPPASYQRRADLQDCRPFLRALLDTPPPSP